jgi:hypothetical protein
MKEVPGEEVDDVPSKCIVLKNDLKLEEMLEIDRKVVLLFRREIKMLNKLQRTILRKKLKNEKLNLLTGVLSINKKLKVLDEMEAEIKRKKES